MVSAAWREAFYAPETDEVVLDLVTLVHPALAAPARVVSDHQAFTHQGEIYLPVGFKVELPEEGQSVSAMAVLTIENVSRDLVTALRVAQGPPTVTIRSVFASAPDDVEEELPDFDLINASFDVAQISGTLAFRDLAQTPFGGLFLPSRWRGLS